MDEAAWDDLRLFLEVATSGGLSGASARTGISAPTIGRRMLALERALGRTLFERSQQGYRLAYHGDILIEHVRSMDRAAKSIADWRTGAFTLPIVTTAAGAWMAGFLADRIAAIRSASDPFRLCCRSAEDGADLAFRGIDVVILPTPPATGNFASLRSVSLRYAVYATAEEAASPTERWVSIATDVARWPADRWVFENHERDIHTWTTSQDLLLRLVRAGAGRGVLPVFVGDDAPGLVRISDPLADLDHPLFIVSHDDERHRPDVRLVIERLADLLRTHAARFSGSASRVTAAAIATPARALQEGSEA